MYVLSDAFQCCFNGSMVLFRTINTMCMYSGVLKEASDKPDPTRMYRAETTYSVATGKWYDFCAFLWILVLILKAFFRKYIIQNEST